MIAAERHSNGHFDMELKYAICVCNWRGALKFLLLNCEAALQ